MFVICPFKFFTPNAHAHRHRWRMKFANLPGAHRFETRAKTLTPPMAKGVRVQTKVIGFISIFLCDDQYEQLILSSYRFQMKK